MVKASDCDSEDRRFKSALSPQLIYGRVAEWFKALSWKDSEGNTSASSNLVSSSTQGTGVMVAFRSPKASVGVRVPSPLPFYLNDMSIYLNGHQLIDSGVPSLKCGGNTVFRRKISCVKRS